MLRVIGVLMYCFTTITIILALLVITASAQTCSTEVQARLTACLDQVERDESQLPGGPCSSSDWTCICTKQQGMADCYSDCPSLMQSDEANFDKYNCAGQHEGVTMQDLGGTLMYTWSDLNVILQGDVAVRENSTGDSTTASDVPSATQGAITSNSTSHASTATPSASSSSSSTNTMNSAPSQLNASTTLLLFVLSMSVFRLFF